MKMGIRQIRLVAFDFDGVIAETIKEWYLLGLEAFNHLGGNLQSSKEVEECFRQARSFLKNAEDCYFVFKAIKERSIDFNTITQEEFDQHSQPFFEKEGKVLAKKVYALRSDLRENDEANWLKLFSVFQEMIPVFKKVIERFEVVIATTRDRASVSAILEEQEITINGHEIISREFSIDKREQMKFITKEFGVSFREMFFIDDILGHLKHVASLGVNLALASWGYANKQQLQEARELGIPILKAPPDIVSHLGI